MAKQSGQYIVGIDIGSTKVSTLVAEAGPENTLEILGVGVAESRGLRKGAVVNLDATAGSIQRSVEEVEQITGLKLHAAYVSIAGSNIKGYNSRGIIALSRHNREIDEADKLRVIDQARALSLASDREIIDVVPQEYTVDGQDGIGDPAGMVGTRMEVAVHIITTPITMRQNIISSVDRAGIEVLGVMLEPLAAAEACLTESEKEFGVAMVNMGGETTSLAIYQRGAVRHTAVFPVGGHHFTNDIAVGLRTPIPEAERIKKEFGCAMGMAVAQSATGQSNHHNIIEVPTVGGRPSRPLSRQVLAEILQPRAEEILTHVRHEIVRAGFDRQLCSGVVMTGGGAMMHGMVEIAESVFDLPVRLGTAEEFEGLSESITDPSYTTVIGLALHGFERHTAEQRATSRPNRRERAAVARMRHWFQKVF